MLFFIYEIYIWQIYFALSFQLFQSDIVVVPDGSRPNCWQAHGWLSDNLTGSVSVCLWKYTLS